MYSPRDYIVFAEKVNSNYSSCCGLTKNRRDGNLGSRRNETMANVNRLLQEIAKRSSMVKMHLNLGKGEGYGPVRHVCIKCQRGVQVDKQVKLCSTCLQDGSKS